MYKLRLQTSQQPQNRPYTPQFHHLIHFSKLLCSSLDEYVVETTLRASVVPSSCSLWSIWVQERSSWIRRGQAAQTTGLLGHDARCYISTEFDLTVRRRGELTSYYVLSRGYDDAVERLQSDTTATDTQEISPSLKRTPLSKLTAYS